MTKTKKALLIVCLILLLLVGIACIVYPVFSSWYNEKHKAKVHTEYLQVLEKTGEEKIEAVRAAAIEYNEKLFRNELPRDNPKGNGYYEQLNLAGNGIMGYIRIPAIDVHLAIYHGAEEPAISTGAGHLPETSLPIGGVDTHAVLSAHSGMASNALFSELERLKVGDCFYIDILGQTLTYQILSADDIAVVLPHETEELGIESGKDKITLLTCTPYGVNTHRLLVTGHRVESPDMTLTAAISSGTEGLTDRLSVRGRNYIKGFAIGLFCACGIILFISIPVLIVKKRKQASAELPHPEPDQILSPDPF